MEFYITRPVGTKRNDNFYFLSFSSFSNLFCFEMKPQQYFLIFFNFLAILLEFSITCRAGTERNHNFYFLTFPSFSNLFWFKMNSEWYFFIFTILLLFFWNFLLSDGWERNGTKIFIFSISRTFPTCFGLKWSHNGIF